METVAAIIEISDIKKRYKNANVDALKGIDLAISVGGFHGILGPNSAGKTTLISIICGLLKADSGTVSIDGKTFLSEANILKSQLGLVPQEIALYPKLTVRENINYFAEMHGIFGTKKQTDVSELMNKLQLDKHASKLITHCSGGIQRRTNIACGMIHQPRILILDEPTVGVDAQSRNLIFDYLTSLNDSGTTIIYTTHYMNEAETLCNEVSVIDNGQIIESGPPKELIDKHANCRDLGEVFLHITGKALRE